MLGRFVFMPNADTKLEAYFSDQVSQQPEELGDRDQSNDVSLLTNGNSKLSKFSVISNQGNPSLFVQWRMHPLAIHYHLPTGLQTHLPVGHRV
jgi:hypothetical protein